MALTKISRSLLDTGVSDSSDATAITIDSSENVGIGTSSPTATLDVAGRFTVSSNDGHSDTKISSTSNRDPRLYFLEGSTQRALIQSTAGTSQLLFSTGTSEAMRIDASGNVGIGTTTPSYKLVTRDATTSNYISVIGAANGNAGITFGDDDANLDGGILFKNDTKDLRFFRGGFTEAMRIDSSGNVLIGTTTANSMKLNIDAGGAHGIFVDDIGTGYDGIQIRGSNTTGSFFALSFKRSNNTLVGYILAESSTTSFVSGSSDLSLKENIVDWNENVLDKFKDIKPVTFNFISDETKQTKKGYIAQNEVDKFPEAYPKNPHDEKYSFNPSGMVTYLMKAIQELSAKVEELESKINE